MKKIEKIKQLDFIKNFIKAQEKELDWMGKEDEEYYKYEIEEKQLLIKGFKTILNLIEKQQAEIEKKDRIIKELEEIFYNYELCEYEITDCTYRKCEDIADDEEKPCKECIKQYFERKIEEREK